MSGTERSRTRSRARNLMQQTVTPGLPVRPMRRCGAKQLGLPVGEQSTFDVGYTHRTPRTCGPNCSPGGSCRNVGRHHASSVTMSPCDRRKNPRGSSRRHGLQRDPASRADPSRDRRQESVGAHDPRPMSTARKGRIAYDRRAPRQRHRSVMAAVFREQLARRHPGDTSPSAQRRKSRRQPQAVRIYHLTRHARACEKPPRHPVFSVGFGPAMPLSPPRPALFSAAPGFPP